MCPSTERRIEHKPTSLAESLYPVDNHLQTKTWLSPVESLWVYKTLFSQTRAQ